MPFIMINQRQCQCDNNITCVLKKIKFLTTLCTVSLLLMKSIKCNNAHLIHINHNEFRSNGFPRTHLSPALPPHTLDELSQHLADKELSPSEYMVDLTNDLAYRILQYHSMLNRNNFAFSPTALMSVLVAIYEGSTGQSMTELNNVLHLPNNNDIIRVGYRDIHRRLRTYFFDTDNPLKGLSLNKENVTITRDYESILMFYGYDLCIDMVSSTTAAAITITVSTTPDTTEATSLKTSTESTITSTTEVLTTTTPAINVFPILESRTETPTTTAENITPTTAEILTTIKPKQAIENVTGRPEESTAETLLTSETPITTENTENSTKLVTEINEAAELISSFAAEENSEPFSRIQKARVTRLPSAKLQAPLTPKVKAHYLPTQRKSGRMIGRTKRHLVGISQFDTNLFVTLLNAESQLHSPLTTGSALVGIPTYVQLSNDYEVETDPNFIKSSQTSSNIKQNYNTDVISHIFYLNNKDIIYTTYKIYNAVLYYKYFYHLRASVLELELDTSEYNLIILLPDYDTDLASVASSLQAGPKLRLMRKQLRPKWVQAIIPDFKLHGTMFLTNDLQNMGISDIFEPNRADFRPMTDDKGIYVKHIEQAINVHIRTNPINQLRHYSDFLANFCRLLVKFSGNSASHSYLFQPILINQCHGTNGAKTQPTQISVNHPFMFFIIDRDLDVAVMTGRILNPLNVRIQ